jgi:general secretion pathway protein B
MSYILDALRKSQQARQPGTAPRTGAVHNISLALPVSGWWLAMGVVLLLGILAAVLLLWRGTVANLPDPPAAPETGEPVAAAPASAAASGTVDRPAPAPELPARNTAPVTDLAEQARLPAPAPPKKIAATRTEKKPAVNHRPETIKTATAPAVPLVMDDTPLLQQMPQDFQRALPALAVTIHVYSHDESQRILFINNREYRKGSQIDGGIRVEDIVPDGAVLSFRGERFKLSRPR